MRLSLEAHPNARVERVELVDDQLRVWVRARPVEGQANAAIEQALANALGLRPRQVHLVSGATRRHKQVEVDLANLDDLRARLSQHR